MQQKQDVQNLTKSKLSIEATLIPKVGFYTKNNFLYLSNLLFNIRN